MPTFHFPFASKRKPLVWAQVQADLNTLQVVPTSTELDPFPTFDVATDTPAAPEHNDLR